MMKTIAYLRVSTTEQNTEKFEADILRFANKNSLVPVEFVSETISGKVHWKKRKIFEVIERLGENDNLLIPELSRLGRTSLEIMEMLQICSEKKIKVYDIKSNWMLNDSIQSKIFALVFSMFAEVERDLISMRTKEALAARKKAGVKLGRPKGKYSSKLTPYKEEINALLQVGVTKTKVAKKYGVDRSTLNNFLQKGGKSE